MLQHQAVSPDLIKLIRELQAEPFFRDFRLVGGTALALQLGHRKSVDIIRESKEKKHKDRIKRAEELLKVKKAKK